MSSEEQKELINRYKIELTKITVEICEQDPMVALSLLLSQSAGVSVYMDYSRDKFLKACLKAFEIVEESFNEKK